MKRADVNKKINKYIELMYLLPADRLDLIIDMHTSLLFKLYAANKLYYKTVFKNNRFILAMYIVSQPYYSEEATFKNITKKMILQGKLSKNTILSFYGTLAITGRIEVKKSKRDGRLLSYNLTNKIKIETYELLHSMCYPLDKLFKEIVNVNNLEVEDFLSYFFSNFRKVVDNDLFSFDSILNAQIFTHRDGGHTIMCALYNNKIHINENLYSTLKLHEIAKKCGVSRSHLKKIVEDAYTVGFITNPASESNIVITEKYCTFFRNYMMRYFSFCLIGMDI